jgi:hypothetical protein
MQAKKYSAVDLEKIHSEVVEKLTKEKKFFIPRYDKDKSIQYSAYYEKLSDYFFEKSIDPELYFGILTLHYIKNKDYYEENKIPCLSATAPLVSSDKAIKIFYAFTKFIEKDGADAKKYVESHYIKMRSEDIKLGRLLVTSDGIKYIKEMIMGEIVRGEIKVKTIQDRRNLNRWDALIFCIDFNMVSDLFVMACKEYKTRGNEIIAYRWRLEDVIRDQSILKVKFKKLIREVSEMYYEQGLREIPKVIKYKRTKKAKTLYEDIN